MIENFKNHRAIRPLIKGGKTAEYSAHLVPEAGFSMIPKLVGDGVLIVGDAAGLCINIGYAVRGMDLVIALVEATAKTVIQAKKKADYSETGLSEYKKLLDESFVMRDLKLYKKFPAFMENKRIFNEYPRLAVNIMEKMFVVDGGENLPLRKKIMQEVKQVGMLNVMKDAIKGVQSL